MWNYFKEHTRPFWIGFTGSGIVWGNILFLDTPVSGTLVAYLLRLIGAAAIAFASGVAAALATDFYKEAKLRAPVMIAKFKLFIKRFKKNKNGRQQKQDKRA